MPSDAHAELQTRLRDVAELIEAHEQLTGGNPGRPADRAGAAVTRAGVVLLAAATESYVEDLFEEAATHIFDGMSEDDFRRLFRNTSKRMNNAAVHNVDMLYFNLGLAWVLSDIRWRKFSNNTFRTELDKLVETRNIISHGRNPPVRLSMLRRWKNMIQMFAPRLEHKVAEHIEWMTEQRPDW